MRVDPMMPSPFIAGSASDRPSRVALYSHDGEGLGHLKRNLLIARSLLAHRQNINALLISGLRETAAYPLPRGVDCLTLPSLSKSSMGGYMARSMNLPVRDITKVRSATLCASLSSYAPDVLIVDKLPLGMLEELRPALESLRQDGTRIVLGMRDILDSSAAVKRDWDISGSTQAIDEFYDAIWVYGDPRVYDVAKEYEFPESVREKITYTGYLNPRDVPVIPTRDRERAGGMNLPSGSLSLCLLGGGRDGLPLAEAFLQSAVPAGSGRVLVTGPRLSGESQSHLRSIAARRSDTTIIEFISDPLPLLCCADRVIAMGGYNTTCEILAFQKRALIVPRARPRTEQLIRARRLESLGFVDVLHPDNLSVSALSSWISACPRGVPSASRAIDFRGVERLCHLFDQTVSGNGGMGEGNGAP